jgi:hypothetical protein
VQDLGDTLTDEMTKTVTCMTDWPVLSQISRAKRMARPTSTIFAGSKDVINGPIFPFETNGHS